MSGRRSGSRLAQLRSRDRSRDRRRDHKAEKKRQDRDGPRFIVPFGAHRGRLMLEVPSTYLVWICGCDGHILARRATRELDRRARIREGGRR